MYGKEYFTIVLKSLTMDDAGRDPLGMKLGVVNEEVSGSCISYSSNCVIGGADTVIKNCVSGLVRKKFNSKYLYHMVLLLLQRIKILYTFQVGSGSGFQYGRILIRYV